MSEPMWTTRDGTRMRLSEMTESHMRNAWAAWVRRIDSTYGTPDESAVLAGGLHSLFLLQSEFQRRNIPYDLDTLRRLWERDEELRPWVYEDRDDFGSFEFPDR